MRKLALLALFFMTIGLFFGCKPSKNDGNKGSGDSANVASATAETVKDSTMYGTYVDGGHGGFMLKCDDDSVREFVVDLDNDSDVVFGGMAAGDQMAVTYRTNGLGEKIVTKAINLTTLQATWTSLDKNFEIEKGGTVQSHQQGEARPWTSWRILNGHLLLNSDTFDIDRLDGDSLLLENHDGIFAYSRLKKQ